MDISKSLTDLFDSFGDVDTESELHQIINSLKSDKDGLEMFLTEQANSGSVDVDLIKNKIESYANKINGKK
jgi:hypothetical protein